MKKLLLILLVVLFSTVAVAKLEEREPADRIADCVYQIHGNAANYSLVHFRGFLTVQYELGLRDAGKDYTEAKGLVSQDNPSADIIGFYGAVSIYLVETIFQTKSKEVAHAALDTVLATLNCNKELTL